MPEKFGATARLQKVGGLEQAQDVIARRTGRAGRHLEGAHPVRHALTPAEDHGAETDAGDLFDSIVVDPPPYGRLEGSGRARLELAVPARGIARRVDGRVVQHERV